MKPILLLTATFAAACVCTASEDTVRNAAEAAGLTDVQPTGYKTFACGKDDTFNSGFTAKNVHGHRVHGVVCCGWAKACTVRYD